MVWRRGSLKRPQMATHAVGRESLTVKLANGPGPVARIAVHGGVRADQRKTILMLIDGMDGDLPATDPMTQVALCSIFPPVQVGMAILAVVSYLGEYQIDMTFPASYPHMHAPQGITRLAVIKLRFAADRFPLRGCMTSFTSDLHRTMRTPGGGSRRRILPGCPRGHLEQ